MKIIFALLLCLFIVSCVSRHYPMAPDLTTPEKSYHLDAGDEIVLRIFDEPDLSGAYPVDSDGMIALPLLGKLNVRNQTEGQAAATIATSLKKRGILLRPTVALDVAKPRPFFILGEVERAGAYPFAAKLTAEQAVAMAGGYTYRANHKKIILKRQAHEFSADEDTMLLPGDTITIGERFF